MCHAALALSLQWGPHDGTNSTGPIWPADIVVENISTRSSTVVPAPPPLPLFSGGRRLQFGDIHYEAVFNAVTTLDISFRITVPLTSTSAASTMIDDLAVSGRTIDFRRETRTQSICGSIICREVAFEAVYVANTSDLVRSGMSCDSGCEITGPAANCTVGHFLDEDSVCTECAPGRTDHDWDFHSQCEDCPPGYTSPAASTSCTPQRCTSGTSVTHASTICTGSTGDICDYQCTQGYVAVGSHVCGRQGAFVGGTCEPVDCTAGLAISNSPSLCSGSTYERCQYTCDCGYSPQGSHVCQPDGNFTGGTCVACTGGQFTRGNGGCGQCADGTAPSASKCDCAPCAPGQAGVGGQCAACPRGRSPNPSSTDCLSCPAGRASSDGISCAECAVGHFSTDGISCNISQPGYRPNAERSGVELCPRDTRGAGGVCIACEPGEASNPGRTECTPCSRRRYKPSGESCMPCDAGSVPNKEIGATFCVSCALQGTADVAGARYASVDWPACNDATVICAPGEQPSESLTECVSCADVGSPAQSASLFSAAGSSCDTCPPGTQPNEDRSACVSCLAGTYSSNGVCLPCTISTQSFSAAGAVQCDSCLAGKQPADDRGSCESCPPGHYSPYGTCQVCQSGKQPADDMTSCIACATIGEMAYSPGGQQCQLCEIGKTPAEDRSVCLNCASGKLGSVGGCVTACQALGCGNITVSTDSGQDFATIEGLSQLCGLLPTWLADTPGGSVDAGTLLGIPCTGASCAIAAPYGSTEFTIDVASGGLSGSCQLQIFVREAKITVPESLEIISLATSYGSAQMRFTNDGDDPVTIFDLIFPMTAVTVDEVTDPDGVPVSLPTEIPADSNILLTIRGEGTAVSPNRYDTNCTVIASTGNELINIDFQVEPATLRVIALPQVMQPALMTAGERGLTTLFTIYNVDISPIRWEIVACVATEDLDNALNAQYTFSECGSGSDDLPPGQSVSITLTYNAPTEVGSYPGTHTIRGAPAGSGSSAESEWNIQSQITVSANVLVPATSTANFPPDITAGDNVALQLTPMDQYGNVIAAYGLSMKASVTYAQSDVLYFYSTFSVNSDNENGPYTIDVKFPRATHAGALYQVQIEVIEPASLAGAQFGVTMFDVEVQPVQCEPNSNGDIVSIANDYGTACVCALGYARVEGECRVCSPGTQPRENRERGCEQCLYYPGTVSVDGRSCETCMVGLRPNGDYTDCIPCGENKYYNFEDNTCKSCSAGMQLNPDVESTQPCVACDSQSAGLTGVCTNCESGKQPKLDTDPPQTSCEECPDGTAGERGRCDLCPAGKHPDSRNTGCELCLPGRYRNDEPLDICTECPEGMISDASSRFIGDCRCPAGEYDVLNANNEIAPIVCWPNGVEGPWKLVKENQASLPDWQGIEISMEAGVVPLQVQRCVRCPACTVCDFEYKGFTEAGEPAIREPPWPEEYRGKPYIQEGWAAYDTDVAPPGAKLPRNTPALSLSIGSPLVGFVGSDGEDRMITARNVFGCPFGTVCRDELEYRNTTGEQRLCKTGYDSQHGLCATCELGWAANKKGCKFCENVGATFGAIFAAFCLILIMLAVRKERKRRKERILGNIQTRSAIAKNLQVLARVIPALMGDVRVFIGVYQTLTNMGTTLAVEFPEDVEVAIDAIKELVNIDIFSFGAVSCIVSGSFYTKLWLSLLLPAGIELGIYAKYDAELDKHGLKNLPGGKDEATVRSHLSELHNKRRIAAAKARSAQGGGFLSRFKRGALDVVMAEEDAENHHQRAFEEDRKLRKLYRKLDRKAEMEQTAIGWAFFVIFLSYPAVTNKIFALFYCYEMDAATAFLMSDYSVDCTTWIYYVHYWICAVLVVVIPVGIPMFFYHLISKAKADILENKGPHHLENLYKDYKPEACLWEVHQMFQKVALIGLLTFVDRGSILQCVTGLCISNGVFVAMVKDQPYLDHKTNVLSTVGQFIVVLSFLSALLMRVNLEGEAYLVDVVGTVLICANIPMMVYLLYDTWVTMQEEINAAQLDMIAAELGGVGAKYKCLNEVNITKKLKGFGKQKNIIGTLREGQEITALDQGFTAKGTARIKFDLLQTLPVSDGDEGGQDPAMTEPQPVWVSYHVGGMAGMRYLALITGEKKPPMTGKLFIGLMRHNKTLLVTVYRAKALRDMDFLGGNDNYVKIFVNGEEKRTTTLYNTGATPMWGAQSNGHPGCEGETLEFENIDEIVSVRFQCFDEDDGGDETDDLIGQCNLPIGEIVDPERETSGEIWKWSGWRTVRESNGDVAQELDVDEKDVITRGDMPPDIPYHMAIAQNLAEKSKTGLALTKAAATKSKAAVANAKNSGKDSEDMDGIEEHQTNNPLARVGVARPKLTFEMEDGTDLSSPTAEDGSLDKATVEVANGMDVESNGDEV